MKTKPFFSLTLSFVLLQLYHYQTFTEMKMKIVWLSRYNTFIHSAIHIWTEQSRPTHTHTHAHIQKHINEKVLSDNVSSTQLSQFKFCHSFDPIIFSFDPFIGLPFLIQLPCKMVLQSIQIFIFVLWIWCCLNVIAFYVMRHMWNCWKCGKKYSCMCGIEANFFPLFFSCFKTTMKVSI